MPTALLIFTDLSARIPPGTLADFEYLPKRASTALPGPARRDVRLSRRPHYFHGIDQFDRVPNSNYSYSVLV